MTNGREGNQAYSKFLDTRATPPLGFCMEALIGRRWLLRGEIPLPIAFLRQQCGFLRDGQSIHDGLHHSGNE